MQLSTITTKKLSYRWETARCICAICNGAADLKTWPSPICVATSSLNLIAVGQMVRAYVWSRSSEKNGFPTSHLSKSLKVIKT